MGSSKVYLKVSDACYLWAKKKNKLRGGCRAGTTREPLGSWCFIQECRLQREALVPFLSQGHAAAGSLPHGTAAAQGALIAAPLNSHPHLSGAGELVLAPGRKGCVHELMGTLQWYFSPYSLFFFCGSVCSLFHLWAKGSIWQCAVHLVATYCEIIMQANLAPSWIS